MIFEHADLRFARDTLRDFVDSVALSRAISEHESHGYSFTIAQRAAFNEAVSTWCILFGSDRADHQPIHWKNLFDMDDFRAGLIGHLGITMDEWRDYRSKLVDYRNDLVAHRSLDPRPAFHPNFDVAMRAADFYHDRLREAARARNGDMDGPGLIEQFEDRLRLCRGQMVVAIEAVRSA